MARKATKTRAFSREAEELEDEDDISHVQDDTEVLVDNSPDVPLLADSDGRTLRSVAYLRVLRMENGGMAYKGQVPKETTIDNLGSQFGDGLYSIEACNVKHRVLNRVENVRISLGLNPGASAAITVSGASSGDLDRIERLTTQVAKDTVRLSESFVTMSQAAARESAERERAFLTTMMTQSQQGFQQMMTLLQTGHSHTIARLEALSTSDKKQDPMVMVAMMMKAMEMGRDWAAAGSGDDDEDEDLPPWEKAAKVLTDGAGLLVNVAKNQLSAHGAPADKNVEKNPPGASGGRRMTPEQTQMVREALQLSAAIRETGLTVPEVLEKLKSASVPPPSANPSSTSADEEEPDELDDNENGEDEDDNESDSDDSDIEEPAGVSGPN